MSHRDSSRVFGGTPRPESFLNGHLDRAFLRKTFVDAIGFRGIWRFDRDGEPLRLVIVFAPTVRAGEERVAIFGKRSVNDFLVEFGGNDSWFTPVRPLVHGRPFQPSDKASFEQILRFALSRLQPSSH